LIICSDPRRSASNLVSLIQCLSTDRSQIQFRFRRDHAWRAALLNPFLHSSDPSFFVRLGS